MLSSTEFAAYCERTKLSAAAVDYISAVRSSPPSRRVGDNARCNVCARIPSKKIGLTVQAESRTCEAVFVYEAELSSDVLEIWDQPTPIQLRRDRGAKGTHVSTYTPDYLLLRRDGPALIECKTAEGLAKKLADKPEDWNYVDGVPYFVPARTAAEKIGLPHEVYVTDDTASRYLANLELLHAVQLSQPVAVSDANYKRLLERLTDSPTIFDLCSARRGPEPAVIYALLASSRIFGALKAQLLSQQDTFRIFADRAQADEFQEHLLQTYRTALDESSETDLAALLRATPAALAHATKVYEQIKEVLDGKRKPTRNDYRYLRRLSDPEASPGHPLAACLPDYRSRGNRVPRLTPDQVRIAQDVIQSHWVLGRCKDQSQLLGHVDAACSEESIPKISKSALRNMCLKIAPEQVAYGRLGIRGYHAARPPVSAEHATVRCEIPGLISHIDSTQFDVRSWSIFKLSMFCEPPWFYVFYDEATDKALGAWLGFGKSDRFALSLAFRDMGARQKRVPPYIAQDRGGEYGSTFWEQLLPRFNSAKYSRASGAPRFGGLEETALKQINFRIANRLDGATWADQHSRAASGNKKSRATARLELAIIIQEARHFWFDEWNKTTHGTADGCPDDLLAQGVQEFGHIGHHVTCDLSYLIATSIPVDITLNKRKGLRCGYREYWSDELNAIRRPYKFEETRLDPANPSTLYVRCDGKWITTHSRDHGVILPLSDEGRFFENYRGRSNSRTARIEGRQSHERIAKRIEQLEASAAAAAACDEANRGTANSTTPPASPSIKPQVEPIDFDQLPDIPFLP
ncbi:MAG: hypothetical protein EPN68_09565 [Rhodanobacter sp.]|nr:MAG: hypothetical protein EPN68_09565 [Rhodanobacter sp.]